MAEAQNDAYSAAFIWKQVAGMVNMFAWVRKSGDLLLFFRYFLF